MRDIKWVIFVYENTKREAIVNTSKKKSQNLRTQKGSIKLKE